MRRSRRGQWFTGGSRLSGAPGYDASADYVADRAAAAGLEDSTQEFDFPLNALADHTPPVLSIVSAGRRERSCRGSGASLFSDGHLELEAPRGF